MTDSSTLRNAYQHCQELATKHSENFPTASKLLSVELRPAVAAIYAFARTADDMADEGDIHAETRIKQLDAWEALLERCQSQAVDHPIFLALADVIQHHEIPVLALHDLLTAFRMDVSIHAYGSEQELLFYCRHSANPVGRLMLALHQVKGHTALAASDAICTALQLTNFWQDLSIDLPRGRCYLPASWLALADTDHTRLLAGDTPCENIQPVMQQAIRFTEALFQRGDALLPLLPFRFRWQIAATLRGGRAVLQSVANSQNILHIRPTLSRSTWVRIIVLSLWDAIKPSPHKVTERL
ncbi:MAG: squalene synthase HpnC [Mariprofundaceae bacterium]